MEGIFILFLAVFLGGLIKGFAGFGYAITGVGLLSFFFNPSEAVILMIFPILAGNLSLAREIDISRLESCLKNFWVLMVSILAGTFLGMYFLGSIPGNILSPFIGLFLIFYVVVKLGYLDLDYLKNICFRENSLFQAVSGLIGGFIFGSMSIGVLIVSYLEGLKLDRKVFVGLLSFVFLVISGLRMIYSWQFGYYSSTQFLSLSILAAIPRLLGVFIGSKIGSESSKSIHKKVVLALFLAIGLRLLTG